MAAPSSRASGLRWRWLLPVLLVLAAFHFTPLGGTLDRAFFDAASRRPLVRAPLPADSAIVLMDNNALTVLSQRGFGNTWPPPRFTFAALVAGLHRAGAARIVLDFIFFEHYAAQEQDALLGALAAAVPSVVLGRTREQTPVFWDEKFVAAHAPLFTAPRMGNVDATLDADGVYRSYRLPGSLAAAALPAGSTDAGGLLRCYGGLAVLNASGDRVSVLSAAPFIDHGMHTITRVMEALGEASPSPEVVARYLAAEPPLAGEGFASVRGRTVFVGVSATGSFDQKTMAIGGLEPGVLVHWTAWANGVGHAFIRPAPFFVAPLLAALFVGLLAWSGVGQAGIARPIAIAAALVLVMLVGAYVALSYGWFFQPFTPIAGTGLALTGVLAENFWIEHRRRREVQTMFGSYVAPEVVELLVRDPAAIRLGGEKREATVFFCDLAGFTDLSEKVSPEELLELINGYLEETSDCLLAHGAYIDKYIGDAVMAVFGAPLAQPRHALAACRGALAAQRCLAERNERLAVSHGRTLGMRIGINTGEMIVGNLGSQRKRNYTVLGDAVNLASRLEGANKEFGTSIMLGENTARLVRDDLVLRPLTGLRVKGKATAVQVFELIGEPSDLTDAQRQFLSAYGEGHAHYVARRFADAVPALTRAAAVVPDDEMTLDLLADARRLAAQPPPPSWEPVLSLKTK